MSGRRRREPARPDADGRDSARCSRRRQLFAERGFEKVTRPRDLREARRQRRRGELSLRRQGRRCIARCVKMAIEIDARDQRAVASRPAAAASPEDQIRGLRAGVRRRALTSTGRTSWIHKLITHELESPSDAFDLVIREVIEPRQKYLSTIIGAISGLPGDDPRVILAGISLQAQCLLFARPLPRKAPAAWRRDWTMPTASSRTWRSSRLPACAG